MGNVKTYVGQDGAKELYRRIKAIIARITGYRKVDGTGADNHPAVATPDTRIIYLVKIPDIVGEDKYKEWIWDVSEQGVGQWDCIGSTSVVENAWKQWSEDNGSSGLSDSVDQSNTSVYLGPANILNRLNSYALGSGNSATTTDETDYSDTDVVLIGSDNSARNAANAYQFGRNNSVTGNNLAYADKYPYSLAMNLGRNNIITGEGLNLGKNNIAENFGVTLGQYDKAYHGSVAIGNKITSSYGSIAIGNGDSEPDAMTAILSLNVGGKFYPAEKIKANVWPTYAHAATKLMTDGKYHWVEAISWPSGVYWSCYVNNELGQYLVTRKGGSSSGRYTGYFDDNGNFIASSDPSHNVHTYTIITQVKKADGTYVSTSFYASVNDSNRAITTSGKSLYVGGYSGEVPDGGTILTQAEYDMLDAGMVDSDWVFSQLQINPNDDTYAIENNYYGYKYFDTADVYGYDTDDGFMPYNFMNKNEEHEFYWKTISMDNIVNSPYKATDLFEPSSLNLISAIHNSIALGKNQEVRSSSIGIAAPLLDKLDLTNIASQKTGSYYLQNINFTQYPINQSTGQAQISTVSKSYLYNADYLSDGTYDLSFAIAQVPAAKHYVDGGSVGIFDRSDSSASRIESGSMGLGAGITANGNSFAIGHHGISASGGSFAAGFSTSTASNGSIAIGGSSASASNGSFVFGNNGSSANAGSLLVGSNGSVAQYGSAGIGHDLRLSDGSYSLGNHNRGSFGAITVGVNAAAANGGVHLSTSNNSIPSLRTASGTLINYTNPDGVQVPVIGNLSLKTGYTITKVRLITGYRLNNVEYRVVLGEYSSSGSFNSYSGYYRLYDMSGQYYGTASMDDSMRSLLYHSTDNNYWRVYNSTTDKYTFIEVDQNHSAINNLSALKQYYKIKCQTFTQDNQLYVYANGFDYPTSGLTDTLIDLSACNFTTSQEWQGVSLGYSESNWKQLTDIGAYGSGVAIGRQAHSYGSSLSLATNNGDDQANDLVTVENELPYPDEVPNGSVSIRIKNNYTSANGYSLAFGSNVTAQGSSLVIGYGNAYAYGRSLSIGFDCNHAESNSFAIGCTTNYAFGNSFAIGKDYNSATGNSFAIGLNSNKASGYSIAMGWMNTANDMSYVFGAMCEANNHSTAFGNTSSAFYNSFACGHNATASDYAVTLGRDSTAYSNSVAFGISTTAKDYSINVGRGGTTAQSGVAFGENNVAIRNAIALGISNTAQDKTVLVGQNNVVNNDGAPSGALVGHDNSMTADGYNTAFGDYNTVSKEAVAIGFNNQAYGWSIAVGSNNRTAYVQGGHATLIGHNNISTSDKETVNWEILTPPGTSRSSTSYFPTTPYQPYGITQQIYTASDLHNVSGTISKLAFKVVSAQNIVRNIKIYIGTTAKKTFSWAPYYDDEWPGSNDWVPISEQTLVYNGNVTFNVGTVEIPLTTSFVLPENTNIVVTVVDNTGSTSYSLSFTCLWTGKTGISLKYQSETPIDTSDLSQYKAGEYPDYYSGVNSNQVAIIFTIGNQTVITDVMDGLSGEVSTNSILMGEKNTSNHYNSMLFGVGNTSLAPLSKDIPDSEHPYDHDDGFVLAIGRENKVGRNYDVAIGYKSVANGGENVAITNSKAIGYRNLAYNQSEMRGVSNIAVNESKFTATVSSTGAEYPNRYICYNELYHSNVDYTTLNEYDSNAFTENMFRHVSANISVGYAGATGNTIFNNKHCQYHNAVIDLEGYCVSENFFVDVGTRNTPSLRYNGSTVSYDSGHTLPDAFTIHAYNKTSSYATIENNIALYSNGYMDKIDSFYNNFTVHADFDLHFNPPSCPYYGINNNVVLHSVVVGTDSVYHGNIGYNFVSGNSVVDLSNCGSASNSGYGMVEYNTVLANSTFVPANDTPSWGGTPNAAVRNFIYDSVAVGTQEVFSFDRGEIKNAMTVFNFGQNYVQSSFNAFVGGRQNHLFGTKQGFVFGNVNNMNHPYYATQNNSDDVFFSDIYVIGSNNGLNSMINNHSDTWTSMSRIYVFGENNNINSTNAFDNHVWGSHNRIGYSSYERISYSRLEGTTVTKATRFLLSENIYVLAGYTTYIDKDDYYFYYNGGVLRSYYDPGVSYISISGDALYNGVTNKTLTNGQWYKATSNPSSSAYKYVPALRASSNVIKYPDGTISLLDDYAVHNTGNTIIGNSSRINPGVCWSTTIGLENEIDNQLTYATSGSFVQGNNNYSTSGSNAIVMGNGNSTTGHNAVAIGSQLIANQWQTVIGKYNEAISSPSRVIDEYKTTSTYGLGEVVWHDDNYYECTVPVQVAESWDANKWTVTNPESDKAIFIVGNGYSETDGSDWQDEAKIHRSNAMTVYADGTVKARQFESDSDVTLAAGNGISITEANNQVTVAVKQSLANLEAFLTANPQPQSGTYMLGSVDGAWAWIQCNTTTIGA